MSSNGRRLLAFDPVYVYPEELSNTDVVQLPQIYLSGVGGVGITANGQSITGLPSPVNPSDAVPKSYIDGIAQGIAFCPSVQVMSATNISSMSGLPTIDTVSLTAGQRVLLTGQTTATQNGIWVVGTGTWTRPASPSQPVVDMYSGSHAAGRACFIEEGAMYAKNGYFCNNLPNQDVVDTNALSFTQFTGLGEITCGNGLSSNYNAIAIALASNSGLQFTGSALDHFLNTTGSLAKDANGLKVTTADTTLTSTSTGLKVLGVPSNFTINQAAVDNNVTAANLNTLNDGPSSLADALHNHTRVLQAQSVGAVHTNGATALATGDPVYWSATGDVLARGDAANYSTATIIGVAATAIAANGTGVIVKKGVITGVLSAATPGFPVYLNVGGGLTQTPPTAAGAVLFQLGFAKNATDLDISIAYVGRRSSSAAS